MRYCYGDYSPTSLFTKDQKNVIEEINNLQLTNSFMQILKSEKLKKSWCVEDFRVLTKIRAILNNDNLLDSINNNREIKWYHDKNKVIDDGKFPVITFMEEFYGLSKNSPTSSENLKYFVYVTSLFQTKEEDIEQNAIRAHHRSFYVHLDERSTYFISKPLYSSLIAFDSLRNLGFKISIWCLSRKEFKQFLDPNVSLENWDKTEKKTNGLF